MTKPVYKKIQLLYFHKKGSIITQYSHSVRINHAAGAVSVCAAVPLLFGASHLCSASLIRAVQDCGFRSEVPTGADVLWTSLSFFPEQVSSARPCSEGLLWVACVCGCNWLATVTTEAQETLPMPQRDWSVYEVASAGQGAIWTSWHLAALSVPYRAVRLKERTHAVTFTHMRTHKRAIVLKPCCDKRRPMLVLWHMCIKQKSRH